MVNKREQYIEVINTLDNRLNFFKEMSKAQNTAADHFEQLGKDFDNPDALLSFSILSSIANIAFLLKREVETVKYASEVEDVLTDADYDRIDEILDYYSHNLEGGRMTNIIMNGVINIMPEPFKKEEELKTKIKADLRSIGREMGVKSEKLIKKGE